MAKMQGSYMGGFSGRLGTAIGYLWNGRWCLRSRPQQVGNPRTEAQVMQREMFKREVQQAAAMRQAVNLGLRGVATEMEMTPYNAFVSLNQHAFRLVEGVFSVDWSSLVLSAGPVAPVSIVEAVVEEGNVLTVRFEKNPEHRSAGNYDSVYLYAYSPQLRSGYLASPVYRREQRMSVVLPEMFEGTDLQLFAIVMNERGQASETVYGGSLTLAAGCCLAASSDSGLAVEAEAVTSNKEEAHAAHADNGADDLAHRHPLVEKPGGGGDDKDRR